MKLSLRGDFSLHKARLSPKFMIKFNDCEREELLLSFLKWIYNDESSLKIDPTNVLVAQGLLQYERIAMGPVS